MRTTRTMGLALAITTLLFAATGCGGGQAAPMNPSSGPAFEAPLAQGYGQPSGAGQPGYAAPDAPQAAPAPPPASASRSMDAESKGNWHRPSKKEGPADRPGLGTQWGETRLSRISTVSFSRADPQSPFAAAALYYNDEQGARAMSAGAGFRRTPSGMFTIANGLVAVGLRDGGGRLFSGFNAGGRNYVVGEAGHRYTIVVSNRTNFRLEVVVSVDGLDVLDGKAAAFHKRGYLIDPRGEIEIDGFRQSMDTVAAFRFGSVRGSYAGLKTGDTRNVGVIGVAVFNEAGTNPVPWTPGEIQQRRDANPFPGQFATPP
jgi:hypothetical protein